ncbi:MAG: O-antigen ligase family protein [Chloroflexi bacterium]|nr:O-antigen ligase family protein [Chloroflexota bacterium]
MKNRQSFTLLILCLLGVTVSLGAILAVTLDQGQRLRGITIGFPGPIEPAERGAGVNVALEQYDDAALQDNLAQIKAAGFTWLRQVFPWSQIEVEEGQFDWTKWDQIVTQSKDFHLIAVLDTAPLWASASNLQPPTSTLQFANFARLFALRYGDRIDYYQIWDEPNLGDRWGGDVNPVAYAELLRQTRDAIKQVDPTATIILAGLAPTVETGPRNLADWLFMRRLYEAGARDLFDVVAGKPYGFDSGPDDARINSSILNFQHFVLLREEMISHGDAGKALWASHFGWNTAANSIWGRVTPGQQIDYARGALQHAAEAWTWTGVMVLENWEPDVPSTDPRWGFSIKDNPNLGQSLVVTSSVGYYPAALQTRAGGPDYVPNPAATFTGEWRFSELGADWSASGDSVSFKLVGTSLALRVRRAADRASLSITIDGQPANALPRDDRGAYLQLIPPEINQTDVQTLPIAYGLSNGEHVVTIVTERGWNQWSFIGWSVGREDDRSVLNSTYGALSVLGLVCAFGAWRNARRVRWREVGGVISAAYARLSSGKQIALTVITALIVYGSAWLTWGVDIAAAYRRAGDAANILATLAAATIFYVSPWLILTIISGLVLLVLVILRLDLGLALVVLFAPFFMLPRQLFESAFSMSELVLVMCVIACVVRGTWSVRQTRSLRITHHASRITLLDWSVLAFLLVSIASTLFADYKVFALRELRVIIFEPVIYYALIRAAKLDDKAIWRLVDALIVAGVLVAMIGLVQYTFGLNLITAEEGTLRLRSVYGSPNNVGLFLGRVLPIGLAVAALGRGLRRRVWYGFALVPIVIALVLSQSRGALLMGVPASILAIGLLAGGRWLWASIGALVLAGVAAIPLLNSPRIQALFNGEGGTSFFRVALWKSALDLIGDRPWLGVGPDNFLYAYRGRYLRPEAWQEPSLSHPHNVLLDFAARLGLLGLAAFVGLQLAFWRVAFTVLRRARTLSIENCALCIGLMASMIDFLAHGLVDAAYFVVDLSFVFMLTLALMQTLDRSEP